MASRVVSIARRLAGAERDHVPDEEMAASARERVENGPLVEALVCLSLAGDGGWLEKPEAQNARARVDLLLWEAGAAALTVPEVGAWLWSDAGAQKRLLFDRSRGSLRERSLAARLLAIAADGMPKIEGAASTSLRVARVADSLATHPEPCVWIPAVRGLGRLAGSIPSIRFQLARWLESSRASERRRAVTALASVPVARGSWVEGHVLEVLDTADPWQLAALGPAVPYLVRERADLWQAIAERMLGRRGPETLWSLTHGLLALARAEGEDDATRHLLGEARARALSARPRSFPEAQLWHVIRRDTDFLDDIDPDPSFPDVLLDRIVRDAVRLGASAVCHRASSVARSIQASFDGLLRSVGTTGSYEERGHALAAVESCALAAALGLWQPILSAAGRDSTEIDEELRAASAHMGSVFAGYLELDQLDFALRRAALRALGNLVDATSPGESPARVAAFALSAVAGSKWARDPDHGDIKRFRKPVTDLLWRVSDALRGGEARDGGAPGLGELVAWWVLCVGGIELVGLLQHDSEEEKQQVAGSVAAIRDACNAATAGASVASWSTDVARALGDLGAANTVLARTMALLVSALDSAEYALSAGLRDELPYVLECMATPAVILGDLGSEPALALAPASLPTDPPGAAAELVSLAESAVSTGSPQPEKVGAEWSRRLGPALRPIVSLAVRRIVEKRRSGVEAVIRKQRIGPYHKIRRLGGGGHGEVWLARRDEGARRCVVKIPNNPLALEDKQREALNRLLEREAKLLESLHEAKVAAFHDYGWDGDTPYLALQYLIGVDLFHYAIERPLTAAEMKPIVRDVCLGLRALHERDIVHRDLKPSNVFLRLQLPRSAKEEFDSAHRDPEIARVAEAVLIDFGIAKLIEDPNALEVDEVEGTLGYLSPEQAESADEITGKADVYGLAATVYTAMTGCRLFEEKPNETKHLVAHALERPFGNERVLHAVRDFPPALVNLLKQATDLDPEARPDVDAFSDRFAAL